MGLKNTLLAVAAAFGPVTLAQQSAYGQCMFSTLPTRSQSPSNPNLQAVEQDGQERLPAFRATLAPIAMLIIRNVCRDRLRHQPPPRRRRHQPRLELLLAPLPPLLEIHSQALRYTLIRITQPKSRPQPFHLSLEQWQQKQRQSPRFQLFSGCKF